MPDGRDRETRFDVPSSWSLPDLGPVTPADGRVDTRAEELTTTYFDTAEATLVSLGVVLCRRTGRPDPGWLLSAPQTFGDDAAGRNEIRSRSRRSTVPKALSDVVGGLLHGQAPTEVATLTTTRATTTVHDAAGAVVVEIADEQVRGTTSADAGAGHEAGFAEWRTLRVRTGPAGADTARAAVRSLLKSSGARRSDDRGELAQLLGAVGRPVASDPATDPLSTYVRAQAAAIVLGELELRRRSDADTVHRVRVAVRRLRSTLRLFGPLLALDRIDPDGDLDADLSWFAGLLGAVRDLDVLQSYVEEQLAALPAEQVVGPVSHQLGEEIARQRQGALDSWRRSWGEERYHRVLAGVGTLVDAVPLAGPGLKRKAWRAAAAEVVATADRTLAKRLRRAGDDPVAAHRARKAAKRLRYAVDLVGADVASDRTGDRARSAQQLLGGHQDQVVAAEFLQAQGVRVGGQPGHNGFTYGLLAERAATQAREIRTGLGR